MLNCIAIPVYKEFNDLNPNEIASLNQLYKILGKHTIFLIGSQDLNWQSYLAHAQSLNIFPHLKNFPGYYFQNIRGYNKLLISKDFYQEFSEYQFLLLYQLDTWVFRDEFNMWCDKGYDYIGAPWTGLYEYDNEPLSGVGNGGFSLRSTKGAFKLLKRLRYYDVLEQYRYFNTKGLLPRLPVLFYKLFTANSKPGRFESEYGWQEDIFWCRAAPKRLANFSCKSVILRILGNYLLRHNFKIAPVEQATAFSFETEPADMYRINNGALPFGCHAWEKYDPGFWQQFIPISMDLPLSK